MHQCLLQQRGGYLQPSLVFCAWATKVFWQGESSAKKQPESKVCILYTVYNNAGTGHIDIYCGILSCIVLHCACIFF